MKKNKWKFNSIIVFLSTMIIIDGIDFSKPEKRNYEIVNEDYFATYDKYKIYIINDSETEDIKINMYDVIVLDEREAKDNVKIVDSYKINDYETQRAIIEIINQYEMMNPTEWERSTDSMQVEWFVHNFLYQLNWQTSRTKDTDFETNEEELYDFHVLKRILTNK